MSATDDKTNGFETHEEGIDPTLIQELAARCKAANIDFEELQWPSDPTSVKIVMKSGRSKRFLNLFSTTQVKSILDFDYEQYSFLSGYDAIFSFETGKVEAAIRSLRTIQSPAVTYRKLFGIKTEWPPSPAMETANIVLNGTEPGLSKIEISRSSDAFKALNFPSAVRQSRQLSLKLTSNPNSNHDQILHLLTKTANSVFFQIDLLADFPLSLQRERSFRRKAPSSRKETSVLDALQYPVTEYDEAPMSLYWYARDATDMPLLQFLAFYQSIEFYFPTYSCAEAHRRLRGILKDPTFRGDRDADIGRLLSAVHIGRGNAFGDERSQLRATLAECIDANELRDFLQSDPVRADFYTKVKSPYHKIPVNNKSADLRSNVADRIYDIRCKIVHSKNDLGGKDFQLLLPFTKEAEQLLFDIELVHFIAKETLIAASSHFRTPFPAS